MIIINNDDADDVNDEQAGSCCKTLSSAAKSTFGFCCPPPPPVSAIVIVNRTMIKQVFSYLPQVVFCKIALECFWGRTRGWVGLGQMIFCHTPHHCVYLATEWLNHSLIQYDWLIDDVHLSHIYTDKILFEVFFGNIEKGLLQKKQNQFVLAERAVNVKIMKNISSKSLQVKQ